MNCTSVLLALAEDVSIQSIFMQNPSDFALSYLELLNLDSKKTKLELDNLIRDYPHIDEVKGLDDILGKHTLAISLIDRTRDTIKISTYLYDIILQARLREQQLLIKSGQWEHFKCDEVFKNFSQQPLQALSSIQGQFKKSLNAIFSEVSQENYLSSLPAEKIKRQMYLGCQNYLDILKSLFEDAIEHEQTSLLEPDYTNNTDNNVISKKWIFFRGTLVAISLILLRFCLCN